MSTATNQPLKKQPPRFLNFSVNRKMAKFSIFLVVVLLFMLYMLCINTRLEVLGMEHKIKALPIPKDWTFVSESSEPDGTIMYVCANPDVSCPVVSYTYLAPAHDNIIQQVSSISNSLIKQGYRITNSCLEGLLCGNEFSKYYVELRKGHASIDISVDPDNPRNIFIGASRD